MNTTDNFATYSVYYGLLGTVKRSGETTASLLEGAYGASEIGNVNGKITYYRAQQDATFAEDPGGEFIKITKSGETFYIHYTHLAVPTAAAKQRMDMQMIVLGIIYQVSNYQMAFLNDLLDDAEDMNKKLAQLAHSFQKYAIVQSGLVNKGFAKVSPEEIDILKNLGIDLPKTNVVVGAISKYIYRSIKYYEDCFGTHTETPHWNDEYAFLVHDGVVKYMNILSVIDSAAGESLPVYTDVEQNTLIQAAESSDKLSVELKSSTPGLLDGYGVKYMRFDAQTETGEILCENGNKTTIHPEYTLICGEMEDGEPCVMNKQDLKSMCDIIRQAMDVINNNLNGVSTMIGVVNGDLQASFSTATAIVAKVEETAKTVTRNMR
ncbi:MAG: hypothetical protein LBS68_01875 [Puniceicoccales bacterium]|nr:hypothetical protein [Puniceicoccales bacterium]